METLQILHNLERIQKLEPKALRSTAAAFNNSKGVIGCITDYLEYEVHQIDKTLANPEELYASKNSETFVAFKLAERAQAVKLITLLTKETTILDDDPSKDI